MSRMIKFQNVNSKFEVISKKKFHFLHHPDSIKQYIRKDRKKSSHAELEFIGMFTLVYFRQRNYRLYLATSHS